MDVRDMTVKECLADPVIRPLLDKHIPELSKYPVALFAQARVRTVAELAVKQGMISREDAERVLDRINDKCAEGDAAHAE